MEKKKEKLWLYKKVNRSQLSKLQPRHDFKFQYNEISMEESFAGKNRDEIAFYSFWY